jgi:hypothetical protein
MSAGAVTYDYIASGNGTYVICARISDNNVEIYLFDYETNLFSLAISMEEVDSKCCDVGIYDAKYYFAVTSNIPNNRYTILYSIDSAGRLFDEGHLKQQDSSQWLSLLPTNNRLYLLTPQVLYDANNLDPGDEKFVPPLDSDTFPCLGVNGNEICMLAQNGAQAQTWTFDYAIVQKWYAEKTTEKEDHL